MGGGAGRGVKTKKKLIKSALSLFSETRNNYLKNTRRLGRHSGRLAA